MTKTLEKTLLDEMQEARAGSPDELVWWLYDLKIEHPVVRLEANEFLTRLRLADMTRTTTQYAFAQDDWVVGPWAKPVIATVANVGVDIGSRKGHRKNFYLLLVVPGYEEVRKVYLNDISSIERITIP